MNTKRIACLALLAASLLPATGFAQAIWTNPGAGSWFIGSNWSGGAAPTDADLAIISSGTAQVDAAGAVASGAITTDSGVLTIQAGGTLTLSSDFNIFRGGVATITGTGSSLASDYLAVGADGGGIGQFTINEGAIVTTTSDPGVTTARIGGNTFAPYGNSTGTVTVTGTGSQWNINRVLLVGNDPGAPDNIGNGTLNVLAGGKVVIGDFPTTEDETTGLVVGDGTLAGTTGAVTVSGAGSELDADNISLGKGTVTGSLTIADGGLVRSAEVDLGSAGGTGHVYLNGTAGNRGTLETADIEAQQGSIEFDGGVLRATGNGVGDWGGDATAGFVVGAGGAFLDTNGYSINMDMPVTGSGTITKLGAGELTILFEEDNPFAGDFAVEAGTLTFDARHFDTSGNGLTVNGGEVDLNEDRAFKSLGGTGGAIDVDRYTLTVNQAANTSYAGDISGDGSFVKDGTGMLVLTGENTWDSNTTVKGGVLRAGSATALPQGGGSTYVVDGGTLDLNGYDLTTQRLSGAGGQINLDTAKLTVNQDGDTIVATAISGGGKFVKDGAGKLMLTGANTFTSPFEFGETVVVHNGTLAVSGAGASLAAADTSIYVGLDATDAATLEIRDGASVTAKRSYIGLAEGSTDSVLVTGAGSKLESPTSLAVGYYGTGTLVVSDGGSVTTGEAEIGYQGAGYGVMTVTGSGSQFSSTTLHVGNETFGQLSIQNGGTVTVDGGAGTVVVAANPATYGFLTIGSSDMTGTAGTLSAAAVALNSTDSILYFTQTNATTFAPSITGPGHVTQSGIGRTTLTGTSTYTGATVVDGGTLLVDGSITSNVTVNGATLGGSGRVGTIVLNDGATLAPGDSIGTLTATSLTWSAGAQFVFELGATTSDLLDLSGALTKSGTGTFAFNFADAGWTEGRTYTLIDFGSTNFSASDFGYLNGGGFNGTFAFDGSTLTFQLVAIPEPSTCALGIIALLVCTVFLRRRGIGRLSQK